MVDRLVDSIGLPDGKETPVAGCGTVFAKVGILRVLVLLLVVPVIGWADESVPGSVAEIAADFDPTAEPLDTRVIRDWEEDGLRLRYVTFHVGTFKNRKARLAGFFAVPKSGRNLPGLLHLHGGGQRAFLHEVKYYARRGYACLSINWGGREMEQSRPGDPNTDWGSVDPTQQNVPGYFNLKPGEKFLDPVESPRNNNWYLLTLGGRRGLTFLERQPEVDPQRLGVYGHSMGGNLTVYVAGTDRRVRVAVPSAGGQGFRTMRWALLPQQRPRVPRGDLGLFRATLGFQSYAPHIKAPLLWLGATNDFHGIMDDTFRTGRLIPSAQVRYAFAVHLNHRFTSEFAVACPLWIDQHLKGTFRFPDTPVSRLSLKGVPRLSVTPDASHPIDRVHILYSVDPDPQARFWRTASVRRHGARWVAELPILSTDHPLFAVANVHYRLKRPEAVQFARPTSTFGITGMLHTATPEHLAVGGASATDRVSSEIDDFSRGFQDWYLLSADNPHHWQFWTRKITDPKWRGPAGARLTFDVKVSHANKLVVVVNENFFRGYRGRQRDVVAAVDLDSCDRWQSVMLPASAFKTPDGKSTLASWDHADQLGFRGFFDSRDGRVVGSKKWSGARPRFRNLRWTLPDP